MATVPTNMSKLPDTKYVRNNTGASGGQKEDTDQDSSVDQMREQCRLHKKYRLTFETQPESSEYAAVLKQWESAMAGVLKLHQMELVNLPECRSHHQKCSL